MDWQYEVVALGTYRMRRVARWGAGGTGPWGEGGDSAARQRGSAWASTSCIARSSHYRHCSTLIKIAYQLGMATRMLITLQKHILVRKV